MRSVENVFVLPQQTNLALDIILKVVLLESCPRSMWFCALLSPIYSWLMLTWNSLCIDRHPYSSKIDSATHQCPMNSCVTYHIPDGLFGYLQTWASFFAAQWKFLVRYEAQGSINQWTQHQVHWSWQIPTFESVIDKPFPGLLKNQVLLLLCVLRGIYDDGICRFMFIRTKQSLLVLVNLLSSIIQSHSWSTINMLAGSRRSQIPSSFVFLGFISRQGLWASGLFLIAFWWIRSE